MFDVAMKVHMLFTHDQLINPPGEGLMHLWVPGRQAMNLRCSRTRPVGEAMQDSCVCVVYASRGCGRVQGHASDMVYSQWMAMA